MRRQMAICDLGSNDITKSLNFNKNKVLLTKANVVI